MTLRVNHPFTIENHTRYIPTLKRRVKKQRNAPTKRSPRPNLLETAIPSCFATHGTPCRCQRAAATCKDCGRNVTVSLGERATPRLEVVRGQVVGYTCVRCK